MGFMDKAREAADDLRSSFTGNEARDSESHYRDLGMIAYLTATGPAHRRGRPPAADQRPVGHRAGRQAAGVPAGDATASATAADAGGTSGSGRTPGTCRAGGTGRTSGGARAARARRTRLSRRPWSRRPNEEKPPTP